jgi:hypothetical protein
MDCTTARLLIDFARPHAGELEADDAAALERHLAGCPDCDRLRHAERQAEERLGRAMRAVEVPPGLRDQLLARLDSERSDWQRRRFARAFRAVAALAAVLLLAWGCWRWLGGRPARIDAPRVWQEYAFERPDRAGVEKSFQREDVAVVVPDLNYALLTAHGVGELPGYPGRFVPLLVFHRDHLEAVVFVLDVRHFEVPDFEPPSGSPYHIERLNPAGERFIYLVLHNGEDLEWLKNPQPPPA